jgi:hypothetical protein
MTTLLAQQIPMSGDFIHFDVAREPLPQERAALSLRYGNGRHGWQAPALPRGRGRYDCQPS